MKMYARYQQRRKILHAQSGVVLTEYLVGTVFVAFALFAPIPGLGESAFVFMLEVLRGFQANTMYLMSMP